MIDVSRFETRGPESRGPETQGVESQGVESQGGGATVNRFEAMQMGIELAGWLGPVHVEPIEDQDDAITESMRASLRAMIERINRQRGQSSPAAEDRGQPPADPRSPAELLPPDGDPPPVTRRQLLEQLRQRREAREQNDSDREP